MHPYSTDVDRRTRVAVVACALVGIALAYGLGWLYSALHASPPWWLDAPAVFGCFGLAWQIYDRWAWRLRVFGNTLSGVVDLRGTWTGEIESSHGGGTTATAKLVVRQTATRMLVSMTTTHSESHSSMAALCAGPGPSEGLRYVYVNRPRTLTPASMAPHDGLVHLRPSSDGRQLDGDYETDRHRGNNSGRLTFRR